MLERAFATSRYLVFLTVIFSIVAALMLYVGTFNIVWQVLLDLFRQPPGTADAGKQLAVTLLKILDILLIALTFQIISVALYRLFIHQGGAESSFFLRVLRINDFHDLKVTILHVAIVILAILFLERAVQTESYLDLLYYGLATSVAIFAMLFAAKQMIHDANINRHSDH